jgi:hypothetical protein
VSAEDRARAPYPLAGQALRATAAKACNARLAQSDWRVLSAVLGMTAGYSRLSDRIYVAAIAQAANVGESTARRSLRKLDGLGIIGFHHKQGSRTAPLITMGGATVTAQLLEQSGRLSPPSVLSSDVPGSNGSQRSTGDRFTAQLVERLPRSIREERTISSREDRTCVVCEEDDKELLAWGGQWYCEKHYRE